MKNIAKKSACIIGTCLLPVIAQASVINFDFTGRLVVADPNGMIVGPAYTPISATLSYDTTTGIGVSNGTGGLNITMDDFYLGQAATFHDISMTRQAGGNLIEGEVQVDWNNNLNMLLLVQWDATGLFNAIDYGLQAGDVLSGSDLYHDTNGNGAQDTGEYIMDISSATPYSDTLQTLAANLQGPAPMAATQGSQGFVDGPFTNIHGYLDIGSGNSMHVTSISTVPVPAAVWLFGSGLLGLIGVARGKRS